MQFRAKSLVVLGAMLMALTMVSVDHAEARKGGSFGSRGTRTFQSAPPTRTAPQPTAPVERSMTPAQQPGAAARPTATNPRPAFNGLGGSLMRGVLLGGLFGLLLGYGFGGLAGAMGMLLQLMLVAGAIFLIVRFMRSRQQPAYATADAQGRQQQQRAQPAPDASWREADAQRPAATNSFGIPKIGGGFPKMGAAAAAAPSRDIEPTAADLDTFERMLSEVQGAFSRQDHAGLRRLATPEMVSYLSEELAQNAVNGVRNDVTDVRLLQADIAEAWQEGDTDYATAALLYEARDVMRDLKTGHAAADTPDELSETTELWTFVRERGGDWKLSAIQEA